MRRNYGRIYPDSIDVSDAACAPKDSVLLFAGSNNIQLTQFPYLFLIIDGDPIIVVDKQSDGALTIKYLLLNDDNEQNLARIDDSEFWINPSIQRFMVPRRDRLVIADHSGHPALNLAFLNPTHLSLSGRFVHHGFVVDIGLTYIDIAIPGRAGHLIFTNDCLRDQQIQVSASGFAMVPPGNPNFIQPKSVSLQNR